MAYDSDEEQIEALKRWWSENGTSLIVSVIIVAGGVFGWRQWESSQNANAAQAADLYQAMASLAAVNPAEDIAAEDIQRARDFNGQLREEHDGSVYARYGALFMAKLHVDADELDQAAEQLQWILDNPGLGLFASANPELLLTTRERLARVRLAQGEPQQALDLLNGAEPGAFAGSFAEVEGDALVALGRQDEARQAYERASQSGAGSALVELKLRDLGAI